MKAVEAAISLIAGALLGASVVFGAMSGRPSPPSPPPIIRTETLVVRDTVIEVRPEVRYVRVTDTLLLTVCDTLRITDTLYMRLPREQKTYSDDSTYRAVVSGVLPFLDTITVWPRTVYIRQTVAELRGSLVVPTVSAGYGVIFHPGGPPSAAPWVGIGIGIDIAEAWRRLSEKNKSLPLPRCVK